MFFSSSTTFENATFLTLPSLAVGYMWWIASISNLGKGGCDGWWSICILGCSLHAHMQPLRSDRHEPGKTLESKERLNHLLENIYMHTNLLPDAKCVCVCVSEEGRDRKKSQLSPKPTSASHVGLLYPVTIPRYCLGCNTHARKHATKELPARPLP